MIIIKRRMQMTTCNWASFRQVVLRFFFLFCFLRRQSYIVYPHPKDGDLAILRTCCDYKYVLVNVCFGSARRKPLERYFLIVICLDRVLIVVKEESYAVVFKPEKRNFNLK